MRLNELKVVCNLKANLRDWYKNAGILNPYYIGIFLYFLAMAQLADTFIVFSRGVPYQWKLYLRNFSSIICLAAIGQYLMMWFSTHVRDYNSSKEKLMFKVITIVTALFSMIKSLCSIDFMLTLLPHGRQFGFYYATDIVAWMVMSIFMITYFLTRLWARVEMGRKCYTVLILFITVVSFVKAFASICYTVLRFNLVGLAWTYFLFDALAWLLISEFLLIYYKSTKMPCLKREDKDRKLDKKTERVAKMG